MPRSLVPATMQAAVVHETDGPFEVLARPVPDVPRGHVLVRIGASGVNPLDTKIRAGVAAHAEHPLPAVLGMDMAGVVVQVGVGVTASRWVTRFTVSSVAWVACKGPWPNTLR